MSAVRRGFVVAWIAGLSACDSSKPAVVSQTSTAPASSPPTSEASPSAETATASAHASSSASSTPWAPPLRSAPSKLAGFAVYESSGVAVSLKSYYVDNVDNQKDAPYPGCPTASDLMRRPGVSVVDSGDRGRTHWMTFRADGAFGVVAFAQHEVQGEYGTQFECCLSGDALAAASARITLAEGDVPVALRACLALVSEDTWTH